MFGWRYLPGGVSPRPPRAPPWVTDRVRQDEGRAVVPVGWLGQVFMATPFVLPAEAGIRGGVSVGERTYIEPIRSRRDPCRLPCPTVGTGSSPANRSPIGVGEDERAVGPWCRWRLPSTYRRKNVTPHPFHRRARTPSFVSPHPDAGPVSTVGRAGVFLNNAVTVGDRLSSLGFARDDILGGMLEVKVCGGVALLVRWVRDRGPERRPGV